MDRIIFRLIREWQFWCILVLAFLVYMFFALSFVEDAKEYEYDRWANSINKYGDMKELKEQINSVQELIEEEKMSWEIEPQEIAALENTEAVLNFLYENGIKYDQAASGNLGGTMMERTVFSDAMTTIVFFILFTASAMLLFIIHTWGKSNGTCVMEYIVQTRKKVFFDELVAYGTVFGSMTIFFSVAIVAFRVFIPSKAMILVFCFEKNVAGISPSLYSFISGVTFFLHLLLFCSLQFFLVHFFSKREVSFLMVLLVPVGLLFAIGRFGGKAATMLSPSPACVISGEIALIWYLVICILKVFLSVLLFAGAYKIHSKIAVIPDND